MVPPGVKGRDVVASSGRKLGMPRKGVNVVKDLDGKMLRKSAKVIVLCTWKMVARN